MKICVFLSSSDAVPERFKKLTHDLGTKIAERGDTLVYGGTNTGPMGIVARAAKAAGGKVIGIIPQKLHDMGRFNSECDELHVTKNLRDRKDLMDDLSDAFVALPGGLGTFEEILEVLNLKYLRYHQKPVIFLNAEGFYDPLFASFEPLFDLRFSKKAITQLFADLPNVGAVYPYLDNYTPVTVEEKWYDRSTDAI